MEATQPLTVPCVRRWLGCEPETRKARFPSRLVKQGGTKVSLGGVGQNYKYRLAAAELFGKLQSGGDVGA